MIHENVYIKKIIDIVIRYIFFTIKITCFQKHRVPLSSADSKIMPTEKQIMSAANLFSSSVILGA
ncbi:hypothetical protein HMPREF9554_02824 [Treponema phagedenis F0421]|nr:hypothetical protein HMPREF9554_02824 [Treponema phagedenis F0421]